MEDGFKREIDYLRISITDRCNFRCRYCMPEKGVEPKKHEDILTFEEILQFVNAAASLGITKVRVTGGEPLVRKGVVGFIEKLSSINGIKDVSMTTNGCLLPDMARHLKEAGLDRVNISLDSLKSQRFREITRCGELSKVLQGIRAALEVGLTPVKINCVVVKGFNDDEIMDFVKLTQEYPLFVRFIELMPLGERGWGKNRFISAQDIKASINQKLIPTGIPAGAGPAIYYKVPKSLGSIGFITPISQHFCPMCNRLRLTADGKLKPCLESDIEIDIKSAFNENKSEEKLKSLFKQALEQKPLRHHMTSEQNADHFRKMWQIGG
jgi:cyclic pyranopterin phosphate synthase